jgi:ParB family chromosome partitioning protein
MPVSSDDPVLGLWGEASTSTVEKTLDRPLQGESREAHRNSRLRLAVSRIDPDFRNPRAPDDADVEALAASMTTDGLLQPIVVRPCGDRYTIVAGHRRFAAWCRCAAAAPSDARWRSIDVVVRQIAEDEALALMLVENLQRKALSPLEEAIALQRLRVMHGWPNKRVAEVVHKSEMYVSRRLRVLDDATLCDAILAGHLAVTTAEELLAVDDRADLVRRAIAHNWSPAEARRAAQARRATKSVIPGRNEQWHAHLTALEDLLKPDAALPAVSRQEIAEALRRLLNLCQA